MRMNKLGVGLMAVVLLTGSPVVMANPGKKAKKATAAAATYTLDAAKSSLVWNGKKVTGEHYGNVSLDKGTLTTNGTQLTGGNVIIDLRTINSTDLKDNKQYHDKLINHLKSDDFFSVEKYPTAAFKITKVTPKGGNQYDVTGDLTIKGKTAPVTFPATVTTKGNTLEATGKATIDRAKYDIRYGSKSFFDNLGDKAIYDDFTIDMKIVASK